MPELRAAMIRLLLRANLMTQNGVLRLAVVLAGLMGAAGVVLAAASAHQADASRLASASSMLLFHASAVIGAALLTGHGIAQRLLGLTATFEIRRPRHGRQKLGQAFARDIALLKQSGVNPIVVHGGGPQIAAMLNKIGIESKFEGGLRVTDQKTVEIVEMVLAGSINKEIVALINAEGEWAIGLCGKDGNMVFAEKARRPWIPIQHRARARSRLRRRAGRGRPHAARPGAKSR
jgi:hypothetical protein